MANDNSSLPAYMADLGNGQTLDRIGQGFCGTVWAAVPYKRQQLCIKREDGAPGRSITHEYEVQRVVSAALMEKDQAGGVLVPICHGFLKKDDPNWQGLLPRFPAGYEACNAMVSERIPPVGEVTRRELIDRYCPEDLQGKIRTGGSNEACLVRLYLGRRRKHVHDPDQPSRRRFFSLRNFPLHADQIEELWLPSCGFAGSMGKALAFLNWGQGLDGNDVEFVLGGRRRMPNCRISNWYSESLGPYDVWMLDFDCCRHITMDEDGVEQIVRAFWRNDPYYPRPGGGAEDEEAWKAFVEAYRHASMKIIRSDAGLRKKHGGKYLEGLVNLVLTRIPQTKGTYTKG